MMDLLDEIWVIVAETLLPPIPAPRAQVNWNKHLNQGDILSLQRVSKVSKGGSVLLSRP
jgi:hypothetical protein